MSANDFSIALPPELIRQFFWGWKFQDLLPVLCVCTRWRAIALDHPSYWLRIDLNRSIHRIGTVELWMLRIHRTYGRPFNMTLSVFDSNWIEPFIVPTLRAHLHHVQELSIWISRACDDTFFSALSVPAPQLEVFRILGYRADGLSTLPHNIFADVAPRLRRLQIASTSRSISTVIPVALASVPELKIDIWRESVHECYDIPAIFSQFPYLRDVTFGDGHFSDPVYRDPRRWTQIARVMFWQSVPTPQMEAFLESTLSSVPVIHLDRCTTKLCQIVILHLLGDLEFQIQPCEYHPDDDAWFTIRIHDRTTRRARVLTEDWSLWTTPDFFRHRHDFFQGADVAGRIVSLTISTVYWAYAATWFIALPVLNQLTLVFEFKDPSRIPTAGSLYAPHVRHMELDGKSEVRVIPCNDLCRFCRTCLSGPAFPITVTQRNVFVVHRCSDDACLSVCSV